MSPTPTQQRDKAIAFARSDPARAYELARKINDPWFACQALAWVGRYWPERDFKAIVSESVSAGRLCQDPYKIAAVVAWPIRAFLERDAVSEAESLFRYALQICLDIPHPGSRAEAIFLLFQAAKPSTPPLWVAALRELILQMKPDTHWRTERNLRHALSMLNNDDLETIKGTDASQQLLAIVSDFLGDTDHSVAKPRPFFQ